MLEYKVVLKVGGGNNKKCLHFINLGTSLTL